VPFIIKNTLLQTAFSAILASGLEYKFYKIQNLIFAKYDITHTFFRKDIFKAEKVMQLKLRHFDGEKLHISHVVIVFLFM